MAGFCLVISNVIHATKNLVVQLFSPDLQVSKKVLFLVKRKSSIKGTLGGTITILMVVKSVFL